MIRYTAKKKSDAWLFTYQIVGPCNFSPFYHLKGEFRANPLKWISLSVDLAVAHTMAGNYQIW